eukprot:2868946-Prymnesium_polylepis.1
MDAMRLCPVRACGSPDSSKFAHTMAGRPTRGSLLGMVRRRARPLPVDALLCPANLASSNVLALDGAAQPFGSRGSSGHSDVGGAVDPRTSCPADQRRLRVDARRMSSPLYDSPLGSPRCGTSPSDLATHALQQPASLPLPGAPPDVQVSRSGSNTRGFATAPRAPPLQPTLRRAPSC